ncbi:MAG: hypothetical protein WC107_01420 [Patescibacteria group bacterium]
MGNKKEENSWDLPKPTLSVTSVIIILAALLLVCSGFLFFLKFNNVFKDFRFTKDNINKPSVFQTIKSNIDDIQGPDVFLKITEDQLAEAIGVEDVDFPIQKAKLSITNDGIILNGKSSNSIFGLNLEVKALPRAENGKIMIDINEITAAGIKAPPKIADPLKDQINTLVANNIPGQDELKVEEIKSNPGFLLLSGTKR